MGSGIRRAVQVRGRGCWQGLKAGSVTSPTLPRGWGGVGYTSARRSALGVSTRPASPRRRTRELGLAGPTWRAPSVVEVLRGLPFLHHAPQASTAAAMLIALTLADACGLLLLVAVLGSQPTPGGRRRPRLGIPPSCCSCCPLHRPCSRCLTPFWSRVSWLVRREPRRGAPQPRRLAPSRPARDHLILQPRAPAEAAFASRTSLHVPASCVQNIPGGS